MGREGGGGREALEFPPALHMYSSICVRGTLCGLLETVGIQLVLRTPCSVLRAPCTQTRAQAAFADVRGVYMYVHVWVDGNVAHLDRYSEEPYHRRTTGQNVLITQPYNSETKPEAAWKLFTETDDFYVRNHSPVPAIGEEDLADYDISFTRCTSAAGEPPFPPFRIGATPIQL